MKILVQYGQFWSLHYQNQFLASTYHNITPQLGNLRSWMSVSFCVSCFMKITVLPTWQRTWNYNWLYIKCQELSGRNTLRHLQCIFRASSVAIWVSSTASYILSGYSTSSWPPLRSLYINNNLKLFILMFINISF